jgi:hypothetical protein
MSAPSLFTDVLRQRVGRCLLRRSAYCGTLQVAAVVQLGVPEPVTPVSMSQVMRFIATPTGKAGSKSAMTGVEVPEALFDAATNWLAQTPVVQLVWPRQAFFVTVVVALLQRQGVPSSWLTAASP